MRVMMDTQGVKALFFDIDGTLLSHRAARIPKSALFALRAARAKNMLLFAATGRHESALRQLPQWKDIPLDGYVCLNGQHCAYRDKTVFVNPIPRAEMETFLRFVEERECICQFSGEHMLFSNQTDAAVRQINETFGVISPPVLPLSHALTLDVLQIELFSEDTSLLQALDWMPSCKWTRWHPMGVDIFRGDGGKWTGITKIMEHLDLTAREIMVFGDHDNDVDMLEHAPFSVALGNGSPAAKAAAKYITRDIDEDGFYHAVSLLLPQLELPPVPPTQ